MEPPALGKTRVEIEQGRKDLRVLVVEDNRECAESLRRLLVLCGYEVVVAHTGQEGIRTARSLQPHIVLCDISLPEGNGYVVASVLRQAGDSTMYAKLIAVTAYGEPQDRRRALAAGFDAHFVKPVDPRMLLGEFEAPPLNHMFG